MLHVFLIGVAAVIIPVQVLLHKIIASYIIGAVGVVRQAEAEAMLSVKPVVIQSTLALTLRGARGCGRG